MSSESQLATHRLRQIPHLASVTLENGIEQLQQVPAAFATSGLLWQDPEGETVAVSGLEDENAVVWLPGWGRFELDSQTL